MDVVLDGLETPAGNVDNFQDEVGRMPKFKCRCGRQFSEADLTPGVALVCPTCQRRLNVDPRRIQAKLERRRAEKRTAGRSPTAPSEDSEADAVELDDAPSQPATLATLSDLPPKPPLPPSGSLPTLSDQPTLGDGDTRSDLADDLRNFDFEDAPIVDLSQRYQIQGLLGRGGMGEVLRAEDLRLKRPVAIKRLKPEVVGSRRMLQRFLTEAQAVARLNHYNIVQIHDYGRSAEGPFLVLELVDGPSLAEELRRGKLSLERAVEITSQLCEALALAHAHGIVHRDIKPANVLLAPGGEPKLTDFGVARQTTSISEDTREGAVLGTLDYMAPEQRIDSHQADARSDQWSLAATLYQMVTSELPRVIDLAAIPSTLRGPLSKALKTRPEERFASVEEFGRALRDALKQGQLTESVVRRLSQGQCPQCQATHNDDGRRFCRRCGALLREPCLQCGSENAAWEQFCRRCGDKLTERVSQRRDELELTRQRIDTAWHGAHFAEARRLLAAFTALDHPRLADLKAWGEARLRKIDEEQRAGEDLRNRLVQQAREALSQSSPEEAARWLEQVPEELRDDTVEQLRRTAEGRAREIQDLRRAIHTAGEQQDDDTLYRLATRFLELNPHDDRIRRIHTRLQMRRTLDRPSATGSDIRSPEPPPLPASSVTSADVPKPPRSAGWGTIIAFGVALVALAGTGVWIARQRTAPQESVAAAPEIVNVVEFYDSEQKRPRYRGQTKAGQREGTWEAWHPNGTVWVKGEFRNDQPRGTWRYFDDGGAACGTRVDGLKTGPWRERDATQITWAEGNYVDDRPEGDWSYRSGQEPFLRVTYRKGVVQSLTIASAGSTEVEYRRVGATPKFQVAVARGLLPDGRGGTRPVRFAADDKTPSIPEALAEQDVPPIEELTWVPEAGPFDPPGEARAGVAPRDFATRVELPDLAALQAVYDQALAAATAAEKERLRREAEVQAARDRLARLRSRQSELEQQQATLAKKRPAGVPDLTTLSQELRQKEQDLEKLEARLDSTKNNLEAARKQLQTLAGRKTPEGMKTSLKKSIDFTRDSVGKGYLPVVNPSTGVMTRRKIDSDKDRQTGQAMVQQLEDLYLSLVNAETSVNNQLKMLEDLATDRVPLEERIRELKPLARDAEELEACVTELADVKRQIATLETELGAPAP